MILITGASGFLGGHLLQAMSLKDVPIRALYHSREPQNSYSGKVQWRSCDLLDVVEVAKAMEGVSQVYHCAAILSFDNRKKEDMIQNNTAFTANIINAALKSNVQKVIHVSSVAALGRQTQKKEVGQPEFINEDSVWQKSKNNSAYAESKYLSELEVWRGIAEGLNAAIINPATILGMGDWEQGSAHLIQIADREFPWFTEGINAWVDVKDVVKAMMLLMESVINGERYILSCGNYSYKHIFSLMAQNLHRRPPYKKANKWKTELVWRIALLKSRLAGKEATITKETARIAQSKNYYSNQKFLTAFPAFQYHDIEQSIAEMSDAYMKDKA